VLVPIFQPRSECIYPPPHGDTYHQSRTPLLRLITLLALCTPAAAQTAATEHTLALDAHSPPAEATIADVAWLAGTWSGPALGGFAEEIWSEPAAGAMMGVFRLLRDEAVVFYEILTITESDGSLLLRLKHFDADLRGWEERDESVDFRLVHLEPDAAYFDGLTFLRPTPDELHIYVASTDDSGAVRELPFHLTRPAGGARP
jgi:hypothetical protein